jgi:hypothetical protein
MHLETLRGSREAEVQGVKARVDATSNYFAGDPTSSVSKSFAPFFPIESFSWRALCRSAALFAGRIALL